MQITILAALALACIPDDAPVEISLVDLSPAYPWDPSRDFDKAYPPEIEAEKDPIKWRRDVPLDDKGFLDLAGVLGGPTKVVVYARVILEAFAPAKLRLSMGSDDGLTILINGKKIFAKNAMRGLKRGEDQTEADLVKGRNVLLFRNPNGAPYACAADDKYLYCAMEGWPGDQWKNRQQIQRFRLSDGKHEKFTETGREDGHINVYEEPQKLIPHDAPKEDTEMMRWPLRDVEVRGEILLVADTIGGRVHGVSVGPVTPRGLRPAALVAQRADDGSVFAFGWSAAWPQPKNNPFWMGGTTLARFDPKGRRLWAARLPETCVGLDAIPGGAGGCMVGSGRSAAIYHYTADGLHVGTLKPGEAMGGESGWMDNHASVAVNRDPRDGRLDVFAEDDYVLRIGWYRVDDRHIRTLAGTVRLP